MKKFLKFFLWSVLGLIVLLGLLIAGFVYKVQNGFPVFYETEVPQISFPEGKKAALLFSKSTGFRHGESIEAGKKAFAALAEKNNWFLYSTEEGGVFNTEQLAKFDLVIFNNSTGRLLNEDQQKNLEAYVENGGNLLGIHGAGDNSHHWDWYVKNLTGSDFSHHSLAPQFEQATITLNPDADSILISGLVPQWTHADEWYVFFESPREHGFTILYSIDGEKIDPSGNILWIKNKNFGMGKEHPVAWYKTTGAGKTYYTSLGHDATAWQQKPFIQLLENILNGL